MSKWPSELHFCHGAGILAFLLEIKEKLNSKLWSIFVGFLKVSWGVGHTWKQCDESTLCFDLIQSLHPPPTVSPPKKSPLSGLRARCLRPARQHLKFWKKIWLWNDVQLQPKLLDRLVEFQAIFKTTFSHRGTNICPICEVSLSYHNLCMRNFGLVPINMYACITHFTGWQKKTQKSASPHWFWSRPMTRNRGHFWGHLERVHEPMSNLLLTTARAPFGQWHHNATSLVHHSSAAVAQWLKCTALVFWCGRPSHPNVGSNPWPGSWCSCSCVLDQDTLP